MRMIARLPTAPGAMMFDSENMFFIMHLAMDWFLNY